jgi:hypothetical protein
MSRITGHLPGQHSTSALAASLRSWLAGSRDPGCDMLSSMWRSLALCSFLALALTTPLRADEGCSQSRLSQLAAGVKEVQQQLLAVKVEEMDTNVPPSTTQQIRNFKDALAAAVDSYVECQQGSAIDAKAFENRLAVLLGANEPERAAPTDPEKMAGQRPRVYGADLKLVVKKPDAKANVIGVQVSFGVACGADTMLLLYEWRDQRWRQVLRWQSGDYNEVSGAYGDFFEYVMVPEGKPDKWAVAVAHGSPWCTSRWSGFGLDVIETAHGGVPQKVLFHRDGGYDRGGDSEPVLKGMTGGFELRLQDMSMDFDVFTRTEIYRYQLVGSDVKRVQPVAMNGRDFVDEWLRSEWDDASAWTAAMNADNLKIEHATIEKLLNPKKPLDRPTFKFRSVRGCSDDTKRFQVELDLDPGGSTYFGIRQGENSFTMLSASSQPDPHCRGANLARQP